MFSIPGWFGAVGSSTFGDDFGIGVSGENSVLGFTSHWKVRFRMMSLMTLMSPSFCYRQLNSQLRRMCGRKLPKTRVTEGDPW